MYWVTVTKSFVESCFSVVMWSLFFVLKQVDLLEPVVLVGLKV